VLRFLLGVAEAGFFPGILFYLTLWFPDHVRGRVSTLFVTALPVASVVGGPLAGCIMQDMQGVYGLHGWQWLFLLEGAPTMLIGLLAYYYLHDGPVAAPWLSSAEKIAVGNDLLDSSSSPAKTTRDFRAAFRNPMVWQLALVYFAYFFALNANLLWSPTLLKSIGEHSVELIGVASGGIALLATFGMILIGRHSDRTLERRWHVGLCGITAAVALLLLPLAANSFIVTVVLLIAASTGLYSVLGLFWTIPSSFLHGSAAAAGIALISSFGALAGSLGPALIGWVKVASGSLYLGLSLVAVLLIISMAALLRLVPAPGAAIQPR